MSKINNYEDLVTERIRIQQALALQKAEINAEIREIRDRFKPLTGLMSYFKGDKNPSIKSTTMQVAANLGIDVLLRNTILGKAGWLTRLVVPFIAKKISSSIIEKTVD